MTRAGDFGIQSGGGGWGGFLIRLGTFSRFSHACIATSDVAGDLVEIVEATPGGARRRWARTDEFVWSRCPLTADQRRTIAEEADKCVGLPYDWASILGFVVRFWGAKLRNQSGDHADEKLICSELCVWAYRRAGHEIGPSAAVAPGDCSPGDLGAHIIQESQ